jgi:quercetin dioxygenase-like cupin family protein
MKRKVLNPTLAAAVAAWMATGLAVATALARSSTETTVAIKSGPELTRTIAGEPLAYPSTPDPVVSSDVVTMQPGAVTPWMTHPVPAYLYVLDGTLTVELVDGSRQKFDAGQSFLQCHTTWHRGRNEGTAPVRFLAVFVGAKGVPDILHPPSGPSVEK